MSSFAVILVAAGRGVRFAGATKKQFARICGKPAWMWSFELFAARRDVTMVMLVLAPDDLDGFAAEHRELLDADSRVRLVAGGAERVDSVANALRVVPTDVDFVAIHDAARPCLTAGAIERLFVAAQATEAATLAAPVRDTVKRADANHRIIETVPRESLWLAQTPQVFRRDLLVRAFAERASGAAVTDDNQLVERLGVPIALVESDAANLKLTTALDLVIAEAILRGRARDGGAP